VFGRDVSGGPSLSTRNNHAKHGQRERPRYRPTSRTTSSWYRLRTRPHRLGPGRTPRVYEAASSVSATRRTVAALQIAIHSFRQAGETMRSSTIRLFLSLSSPIAFGRTTRYSDFTHSGVAIPILQPGLLLNFDGITVDHSVDGRTLVGSALADVLRSILFDWWETSRPSLLAASPERSEFSAQGRPPYTCAGPPPGQGPWGAHSLAPPSGCA
jgi:hypothetical protein